MAASQIKLPPGFQLETPGKPVAAKTAGNAGGANLPPGFVLENAQGFDSSPQKQEPKGLLAQAAEKAQEVVGKGMGRAALKIASNPLIPPIISGTVAPALALGKAAVEHPREAAITAGAIAAPQFVGPGLITSALASGGGAALGSLASDVGEKALGTPTAPKTLKESLVKAGKVGGTTTAAEIAVGLPLMALGKVGKTVMRAVTAAKKTANVEAAGQAIGAVEDAVGLSKVPLKSFNEPGAADAYINQTMKIKSPESLGTDELYALHKDAQTIGRTYPKFKDTPVGARFFKKVQKVRDILFERVPELGAKNAAYAQELVKETADKARVVDKIKATRAVKKALRYALGTVGAGAGYGVTRSLLE